MAVFTTTVLEFLSVSFFVSRISYIIYSIGKRGDGMVYFAAAASACGFLEPGQEGIVPTLASFLAALHYYQYSPIPLQGCFFSICSDLNRGRLHPSLPTLSSVRVILPPMHDVVMFVEDVRTIPTTHHQRTDRSET